MRDQNITRGWTNEHRTCTSKTRHSTRRKALREVDRQWQRHHVVIEIYRCPWCDGWHLTSQLKPKRQSTSPGKDEQDGRGTM